ncbi:hypothetical protein Q8W71_26935 [Methylobacterium sp. NEAU 140]|uniref:hypothetical protein n=1 Tax=Methylobacterium sp. NEAU 140 TaxID=3064945 RepID=UPI00273728BE|nr:hypothetical protein [Methylobacterium sp. NEAU 140]MDP4026267.1 hypothetical protein [Methylobacterium sp. NEAU 140]
MALLGHVGTLTHRRIAGWAWESDAPNVPVTVLVAIERRVLGRCRADRFREDLAIEGLGTGRCGFALDLPAGRLALRRGYAISVRREGDGLHLPGSPYLLEPAIQIVRGA